jgi:predicted dienelactone hydrolase
VEQDASLDAADVIKKAMEIRTRDVQFVLDQLSDLKTNRNPDTENKKLPAGFSDTLNLSRIGMFGHSAGGDTTAGAMHIDDNKIHL